MPRKSKNQNLLLSFTRSGLGQKINALGEFFSSTWFLYSVLFAISIISWLYYYQANLTLTYNDARSHLNISRRVVDSLQPGFAQIGSVWLPLQHVLQLPTIWNDFMFRTGLSGSIISMLSFVGSSILIHKTARILGLSKLAAMIAMLVFATNPNMLYMQATPMTESLMIFTSLGAIYFFIKWIKNHRVENLILSAAMTFLAILTRYDGWFIFGALATLIAYYSYKNFPKAHIESNVIIYSSVGIFAIGLWLMWNLLIFGNPIYFLDGPFSAKAQQDVLFREGRLLTKHNLPFSTLTYAVATTQITGWATAAIGVLGISYTLISKSSIKMKLALLALCVPIAFNIISLFLGHSVIHLPQLPPYTYFNDRYGLMALPAIAFGIAYLANKKVLLAMLAVVVLFSQNYTMYKNNDLITIADGKSGASGYYLDDIGDWLNTNANTGLILVAASSHDSLIFVSGLPLNRFITEGAYEYWGPSLITPTKYAEFVIMHDGDLVYKNLSQNTDFTNHYELVYQGQYSNVYQKTGFAPHAALQFAPTQ